MATLGLTTAALSRGWEPGTGSWWLGMLINPADVAAVADGVVVNAIWAVGQMVVRPRESRRAAVAMEMAGWMDTERLTREGLPGARLELPGLTDADAAELGSALGRDEAQAAIQALLAARLTDAPEADAARAREAVRLALGRAPHAGPMSGYLDDKVGALVATLEGRVGLAGLAQVRAEAYNSRIVALLGTIADMLTALSHPDRGGAQEAEFLRRYRRQVRERHGKLEPPDFERRRRVPIADIYVPTSIGQDPDPERTAALPSPAPTALTVLDLAARLDRTVLLGDPGGGKTTAANVLADAFAGDPGGKVPFLVTLRDYAAKHPPERSAAGHVEQTLATLYQCPAPAGLVERLLLTGRAVVIFDGLDELLDTSRRAEVSALVEQFGAAYPLTPVLVTSRLVGYDEARLDDDQFRCYRLGGFGENEVGEYARKWFALQEGFSAAEADAESVAFLAESASVPDLRANPLLLSLMCILYRGEGFLPRNRADVYEECANLLFRKWDVRRRIHQDLRAGHVVEPAIRHLAWWLFNRENSQTAVTEGELIDETTAFLHGREFESATEAREAAREFVGFCRGRMWVLSDTGTTADGRRLYSFTHRTFLEYFAAAHLTAASDTPEDLARAIAARLENAGWEVIGELAIQMKGKAADRGADRAYLVLLDAAAGEAAGAEPAGRLLDFLAKCLRSVDVSPQAVRKLTQATLDYLLVPGGMASDNHRPLSAMLANGGRSQEFISDEVTSRIAALAASEQPAQRTDGMRLILLARYITVRDSPWQRRTRELAGAYAAEITAAADRDIAFRNWAVTYDFISLEQALAMPSGFAGLMEGVTATIPPSLISYPLRQLEGLEPSGIEPGRRARGNLTAIGQHLLGRPWPPLLRLPSPGGESAGFGSNYHYNKTVIELICTRNMSALDWADERLGLAICTIIGMGVELSDLTESDIRYAAAEQTPGPASLLHRYLQRRLTGDAGPLPDLPVPGRFRPSFQDWAAGRVSFVEFRAE